MNDKAEFSAICQIKKVSDTVFFHLWNLRRHGLAKAGRLQLFIEYMRRDWNVFFNLPLAAFTALVNLCIIC